jgi:voltage-gated potassium channel
MNETLVPEAEKPPVEKPVEEERWELLSNLDRLLDRPLMVLGIVWLALIIADFASGHDPTLEALTYAIWALFIFDYALELLIAPDRSAYLRRHWFGLFALAVPALRGLVVLRALRAARGLHLLRATSLARILASTNKALAALNTFLGHRRLGLVIASTFIVMVAGAAGIYAFERDPAATGPAINDYGDALWWSAMLMTTVGSEFWPQTVEGRVVAWLMAVYALAIFGYITAYLASIFLKPAMPSSED